jgi:hypothetical protein
MQERSPENAHWRLVGFIQLLTFSKEWCMLATYEELDLVRIIGEENVNYQKRVPKRFIR